MARVLIIETGDDWRALAVPEDWDLDDVDRYLNGMAYGRAAVLTVAEMAESEMIAGGVRDALGGWQDEGESRDSFLPADGGEYGGGSV